MTYNNPNHCNMMDLSHTPTRPPWRPAASSIITFKENDNLVQCSFCLRQRSTKLAVPPQHMSVTDLIAAMPKRHRVPKPQTLCNSYGLAVDPYNQRMMLKTPYTTLGSDPLYEHLEVEKLEKRSSKQMPKSVLEQATRSVVSSQLQQKSATHGSHLASPPSGVRTLLSSAAPSMVPNLEQHHYSTTSQHSAIATPMSQPTSLQHRISPSFDHASPASRARSATGSPICSQYSSSTQIVPHTSGTNNSCLVSVNDHLSHSSTHATRSRSSKFNNNNTRGGNINIDYYPSRQTTGGSTPQVAHSRCSSQTISRHFTPSHKSVCDKSSPLSGRCSPPTPPTPLSP